MNASDHPDPYLLDPRSVSHDPEREENTITAFHTAVLDSIHRSLELNRSHDPSDGDTTVIHEVLKKELTVKLMKDVHEPGRSLRNIGTYLRDCRATVTDPDKLLRAIFSEELLPESASRPKGPVLAGLENVCSEAQTIMAKARHEEHVSTFEAFLASRTWGDSRLGWREAASEAAKERLEHLESLSEPLNQAARTSLYDLAFRVVASHLDEVFSLGKYLLASARHVDGSRVTWEHFAAQPSWQTYVESEAERLLLRLDRLDEYEGFLSARLGALQDEPATMETMFRASSDLKHDRGYLENLTFRDEVYENEDAARIQKEQSRNVTAAWREWQERYELRSRALSQDST